MNPALVALAGTVTEAGTVTAVLLLERLTVSPPLCLPPRSGLPCRHHCPRPSSKSASAGERAQRGVLPAVVPVPLRLTTAVGLVEELLVMVS